MTTVTVSSKYQVVIPRELRDRLKIHAGQKLHVLSRNGIIQLVPDRDIREMEGIFPGLSSEGLRDEEDRV